MSADIIIPVGILVVLVFIVWRLNRKKTKETTTFTPTTPKATRDLAAQVNQFDNDEKTPQKEFDLPEGFLEFKLLGYDKLTEEQQDVIVEISKAFRKPHPLLVPLTRGIFEPNELFELIKTDVEMTAKILNAVNSPLFALRQPITNINHAIIFLGITQVKNIALQVAVQNDMEFKDKAQNEAYQKLWKASYLASSFSLLFAVEMGEENPAELSTHCLLSYLGDLAILSYKPSLAGFYLDDYTLYERTKVFQKTLGTNAAIVGRYLAKQWKLPTSIEVGIDHSILPLTNETTHKAFTPTELRQVMLCYLSCRLGDLVAFSDVRDISKVTEVSFETLGEIEFYYTQDNIKSSGLDKINSVIADPAFKRKVHKIIEQTSM